MSCGGALKQCSYYYPKEITGLMVLLMCLPLWHLHTAEELQPGTKHLVRPRHIHISPKMIKIYLTLFHIVSLHKRILSAIVLALSSQYKIM